jgi:cytoskeletal protein CcmA (bactofilin family)
VSRPRRPRSACLRLHDLETRCVPATFTVTVPDDDGPGSLRQAIVDANTTANIGDPDRIEFAIPGSGVQTIGLLSPLPDITDAVVIDGYTQPGASQNTLASGNDAVLLVELDGTLAGTASALNLVAGGSTVQGLVINRFTGDGIDVSGDGNIVAGNFIGTDAAGAANLGNGGAGVAIVGTAQNVRVGGDTPAGQNRIRFNGGNGILVTTSGSGNDLRRNAVYDNGLLDIDLGGDGVTANDPLDADTGPNGLQNYPVITTATTYPGRTTIAGTLDSTPDTTFTLDFYTSPAAAPSGFGPGQTFLATTSVTTDAGGHAGFALVVLVDTAAGDVVSATATDPAGSMSEFAQSVPVRLPYQATLDAIVLDPNADGIDLGGTATTSLLTGQLADTRWTQAGSDDAFLVVDATSLRATGYDLHDFDGTPLDGPVLFRDGLRIQTAGEPETFVTDGWQMLDRLDANKDGRIDAADPAWGSLKLFTDSDADGTIGPGELTDLPAAGIRDLIANPNPPARLDDFGSRREDGGFTRTDGTVGLATDVWFTHSDGTSTAPATFHWTGAVSADWYDPGNWSPNGVPSALDAAVIDSGTADFGAAPEGVASLSVFGGTVTGTGTLSVTRLTWTGGTLGGTVAVSGGGAWQARGPDAKLLTGHLDSAGDGSVARGFDPVVLDLNGDGLNLTGSVTTNLLTGQPAQFRWTTPNPDDVFLAVDATGLRTLGYDLRTYADQPLNGTVLLTGGMRLRTPDGDDRVMADAWQLLAALDRSGDGRFDANEPAWDDVRLFMDADADGVISPDLGEVQDPATRGVIGIQFDPAATPATISGGSMATDGLFVRSSGSTDLAAQVSFGSFGSRATTIQFGAGATLDTTGTGGLHLDTAEPVLLAGAGAVTNGGVVNWTGSGGIGLSGGATLTNQAGGTLVLNRAPPVGSGPIDDIQLASGSTLTNAAGGTVRITSDFAVGITGGAFSNAGTVSWTGTGDVRLSGGADWVNQTGGVLVIDRTTPVGTVPMNNLVLGSGSALTNQSGAQIQIPSAQPFGIIGGTVDNAGTVSWTGTGDLVLSSGADLNNQAGGLFDIQISQLAAIQMTGGARIDNGSGATVRLLSDQTLTLSGGTLDNAGTVSWTGSGSLALTTGMRVNNLAGGRIDLHRAAPTGPDPIAGIGIELLSALTNATGATIDVDSPAAVNNITGPGGFTTDGALDVHQHTLRIGAPGSSTGAMSVAAGATLDFAGNFVLDPGANITGAGTVHVDGTLTVNGNVGTPDLTIDPTGTVNVTGTLTSATPVLVNGTLAGTGTVSADVVNAGTVSPGPGTAHLSILGNYTQTPAGTLDIELGGTTAGVTYDQLAVSGSANLAGTLALSVVNGFAPANGDTFLPLMYASRTGGFDSVTGVDLPTARLSVVEGPTAVTVVARNPVPGPTFTDQDGDTYTVKLTGPGTATVFIDDPDGDGKGPIDQIRLSGTDGKKSRLTITVKKNRLGGDGLVSLGSVVGSGLAAITARTSDLVGSLGHGIELTGPLGGLTLRDIKNGTDVTAAGDLLQKTNVKARVIEDGTAFNLGTAINAFTAVRFTNGSITAPLMGSFRITGDKRAAIAGDFRGNVSLTATVPTSLRSASIAGAVSGSHFDLTGSLGSFVAGSMIDSTVYAAFLPNTPADPMQGGVFAPAFKIGAVIVKGTFDGSTVASDTVARVSIGTLVTDNGGTKFGVLGHTKVALVTIANPKTTIKPAALPQTMGDFEVKLA